MDDGEAVPGKLLRERVPPEGLQILASETLDLQGDAHRLVTFLNRALKDRGLIFGLSRTADRRLQLTIYEA